MNESVLGSSIEKGLARNELIRRMDHEIQEIQKRIESLPDDKLWEILNTPEPGETE